MVPVWTTAHPKDGVARVCVNAHCYMAQEKWDWVLPPALLMQSYATMHLDLGGAKALALALVSQPAETA